MTYSDNYNIRTKNVKFNDVADAIDDSLTRSYAGVSTGIVNQYNASPTPQWTIYSPGDLLVLIPHVTNTGASTVNVSGLGVKAIKRAGADLAAGDLLVNVPTVLVYSGSYFESLIVQNALNRDGTNFMTGDLNLGGFRLKNSSLGTAAAPAIYPGSDSNTGIFYPAADTWAISTNGAERLRVLSDGNIGIGTTAPAELLHLRSVAPRIRLEDTDGGGAYSSISGNSTSGNVFIQADPSNIAASTLIGFDVDGATRMTLSSSDLSTTTNFSAALGTLTGLTVGTGSSGSNIVIRNHNNTNIAWVLATRTDVGGSNQDLKFLRYTGGGTAYAGIAMQISNDYGSIGFGTTPAINTIATQLDIGNGAAAFGFAYQSYFGNNFYYEGAWKYRQSAGATVVVGDNTGNILFYTAPSGSAGSVIGLTERMRIAQAGNISMGATLSVAGSFLIAKTSEVVTGAGSYFTQAGVSTYPAILVNCKSAAGLVMTLQNHSNGTYVGGINYNDTSTGFPTSSDYRLKENEVPISNGVERILQLKPYRLNFKITPNDTIDAFFAHEVQEVVPNAVEGDKDAVYEDGRIKIQSIDHSKLVPLLTAAIKELAVRLKTLEEIIN